jgi:hypothetical protein
MFGAINKTINYAVETLQSYLSSTVISTGLNSIYQSIQQLFTRGKTQTDPIPAAPLSTQQFVSLPAKEDTPPAVDIENMLLELGFITSQPLDSYAKTMQAMRREKIWNQFNESEPIKQHRSITLAIKISSTHLTKYLSSSYLARANDEVSRDKGSHGVREIVSLSPNVEEKIHALVKAGWQLIGNVKTGKATEQEFNTLVKFIALQDPLFREFEIKLKAAEEEEAEAVRKKQKQQEAEAIAVAALQPLAISSEQRGDGLHISKDTQQV